MGLSEDLMSKCSENLSAYKSACEEHPDLKAFDDKLQQRTNKVIDSLTVQDTTGKSSQHEVHMEVSKHLLDITQGVTNFITEADHNVLENGALKSLVNAYFDNTKKTLEIFNTIGKCVQDAELSQFYLQQAVAEFKNKSAGNDVGGRKKKYKKTLEELKKFNAKGDPFDGKVLQTQFELIKKQQESLLEEVSEVIKGLEDEIANQNNTKKIVNVVFGAAVAVAVVASIALMSTGVGLVTVGATTALAGQLVAAGWAVVVTNLQRKVDAMNKELEHLKKVKELEDVVGKGTEINEEVSETVSLEVMGLEDRIHTMLEIVDNAIENKDDEEKIKNSLELIQKRVEKLTEKMTEVGETVTEHTKLIAEARLHVLQKIYRDK